MRVRLDRRRVEIGRPQGEIGVHAKGGVEGRYPSGLADAGVEGQCEWPEIEFPVEGGLVAVQNGPTEEVDHSAVEAFRRGVALGVVRRRRLVFKSRAR